MGANKLTPIICRMYLLRMESLRMDMKIGFMNIKFTYVSFPCSLGSIIFT